MRHGSPRFGQPVPGWVLVPAALVALAVPSQAVAEAPKHLTGTIGAHVDYSRSTETSTYSGTRDIKVHARFKQDPFDIHRWVDSGTTIDITGDSIEHAHCDPDDDSTQTIHEDGHGIAVTSDQYADNVTASPQFDFFAPYHANTSGDGCGSGFTSQADGKNDVNLLPRDNAGNSWNHPVFSHGKLKAVKLDYKGTFQDGPTTETYAASGTLTVSGARAKKHGSACHVPNLHKLTVAKAKQRLIHANCRLGKQTRKASKTVAKGHVIAQHPAAGTKLAGGSKVAVTVSRG
jgi:hypothetical protein